MGSVQRSEAGRERAHAGIAIDLQVENLHGQRVPGLGALNEEWPRQRIVTLHHAQRVAGLLQHVAETVERIGIKNIAGLQMRYWLGGLEEGLPLVGVGA